MILVTGATGNVGRPLLDLLGEAGTPVRGVSRDPRAADLPAHVEVVEGNPSEPATITAALGGVTSLFLNPRTVGHAAAALLARAAEHGVKRVVVLSASNVDDDLARQPSRHRGDLNRETEDAVTAAGLEWVSLRPAVFATNTLGLWGAQIRAGDVVYGPYAGAASAPIHERDVAAVAARALLGDVASGTRHVLTGPQSLTDPELVTTIGEVLGRPLRHREITPEAAWRALVQQGFPAAFAEAYLAMQSVAVARPAPTTGGVADVLGRPPLTFAAWVAEHADAFRARTDRTGGRR